MSERTAVLVVILVAATLVASVSMHFAERSVRRARERARLRAAVDRNRTDYPIVYEWPYCRVVIHEDSFTSDIMGARFAAPIASIWRVTKASAGKAGFYWRVLCHADSEDPPEMQLHGEMGELVAIVLAHKAGVEVE